MTLLPRPCSMHDIDDVEAFVRASITRSRVRLSPQQRDELVAEGLVVMVDLCNRFNPHMDGYAKAGTFAGYAARFMPAKMKEAYHRMFEHHVPRALPDGTRTVEYFEAAGSLQQTMEENPGAITESTKSVGHMAPRAREAA